MRRLSELAGLWFAGLLAGLLVASVALAQHYEGNNGDNSFVGTNGDDSFNTHDGADEAYGQNGGDEFHMGPGRDIAVGEDGWDDIEGGEGADDRYNPFFGGHTGLGGGGGKDSVNGDEADDILKGAQDDDGLHGGPASDLVDGWDNAFQNDGLYGGDGAGDVCKADGHRNNVGDPWNLYDTVATSCEFLSVQEVGVPT